ncbi:MAG: hypothetical protein LBQ46_13470, partial [Treponema sp.]|nr:hypothetical protein [Treponema sp.]
MDSNVAYGFLIWIIVCVSTLVSNYHIYDIYLDDRHIDLMAVRKRKRLELSDFKVYEVRIIRYPVFLFRTDRGSFWVNYTKANYTVLLKILELLKYKNIEHFKKHVRTFIISPKT